MLLKQEIYRKPIQCLSIFWLIFAANLNSIAEVADAHCIAGCPLGAPSENGLIIRAIYSMSYNQENRMADWAAYTVSSGSIGIASSLSRDLIIDPYIKETLSTDDFIEPSDEALNQGQLIPLVNFAGTPFWRDVNFLTNTIAITESLNRGPWYGLNWSIRNMVNREGRVFVLSGPVYYDDQPMRLSTPLAHKVPNAFFKVIISERNQLSAFLLDQNTQVHVHHCELKSSVDEIEQLTGLRLLPEIDTSNYRSLDEALGCN